MITVRDVLATWTKLNEFRTKNSLLTLHAATLTPEDIERLPEAMMARLKRNEQATALFQEIGKQICADHGIEWGSRPMSPLDDATISSEAEKKFSTFLDFIASH